ncbi:MAG TPA: hypothetical protein V6C46_03635 [Coleofasciculaceae cyanobacterium]
MTKHRRIHLFLLLLIAVFGQTLYAQRAVSQRAVSQTEELQQKYRSAVQDAAFVEQGENIGEDGNPILIQVTLDNPLLKGSWNPDQTRLLVVSWKSKRGSDLLQASNKSPEEKTERLIWVTVAPQIKDFCQQFLKNNPNATKEELELRLKQYLGLAPDWQYDVFVEMWVSPKDLIRPCVNPQIDSQQCELAFDDKYTPKELPGITPGAAIKDYRSFYRKLYFDSIRPSRFDPNNPNASVRQPFTGLGYTYDWGNPDHHRGASEFILIPGAAYTVNQKPVPTQEYCKPNP